jgi:hypothetical protein
MLDPSSRSSRTPTLRLVVAGVQAVDAAEVDKELLDDFELADVLLGGLDVLVGAEVFLHDLTFHMSLSIDQLRSGDEPLTKTDINDA